MHGRNLGVAAAKANRNARISAVMLYHSILRIYRYKEILREIEMQICNN
jgi:hypothetical protein